MAFKYDQVLSGTHLSIMTVLGPIPSCEMGHCQCHEHLFIARGKPVEVHPALWIDSFDRTLNELKDYKESGGGAVVDCQPVGCGRMAEELVHASEESGVSIVASTGFHKLMFYPDNHWIHFWNERRLSDLFLSEINSGMFLDGDASEPSLRIEARAGIIKTALDSCGIQGEYVKLFEAAVHAALSSGVPIQCHIEKGADAVEVVEFLVERGVSPNSIILAHLDRTRYDVRYHMDVASTGVFLQYDTIGRFKYHSDDDEVRLIASMLEAGYGDRLLVGLDTTRERLRRYGGEIGLTYLLDVFIPLLLESGLHKIDIDRMTIVNSQTVLTSAFRIA